MFERLNTGGQRLNAQELRNCVYSSPFATLLVELAGYSTFNDLCDIPRYSDHLIDGKISTELAQNTLFKRMIDCELVLRFFAFREKRAIRGSVKSILDKCMESHASDSQEELLALADDFRSRVDLASTLLGPTAFKLLDPDDGKLYLSQPYYDAIMVACDRLFEERKALLQSKSQLRKHLQQVLRKPGNHELIVGKANTAESIKKRLNFIEGCFQAVL